MQQSNLGFLLIPRTKFDTHFQPQAGWLWESHIYFIARAGGGTRSTMINNYIILRLPMKSATLLIVDSLFAEIVQPLERVKVHPHYLFLFDTSVLRSFFKTFIVFLKESNGKVRKGDCHTSISHVHASSVGHRTGHGGDPPRPRGATACAPWQVSNSCDASVGGGGSSGCPKGVQDRLKLCETSSELDSHQFAMQGTSQGFVQGTMVISQTGNLRRSSPCHQHEWTCNCRSEEKGE